MKRGTPEHPKMKELARLLNIPLYSAVGIMEMLWHFTAKYAPQGDIGKFSDADIAAAVGWEVRSGSKGVRTEVRLGSALVHAGFLETSPQHRLVVHDWHDHADQAVARRLARQRLDFVRPISSLPEPEPVPEPEPQRPVLSDHAERKPDPLPAATITSKAVFETERQDLWFWFQEGYPGELNPDFDCQIFMSVIETTADITLMRENLPKWKASDKWQNGYIHSAENFLRKRVFKNPPKPKPDEYVYTPLDNKQDIEILEERERRRKENQAETREWLKELAAKEAALKSKVEPAAQIPPDDHTCARMLYVTPNGVTTEKPAEKPQEDDNSEPLLDWMGKNSPDQVEV